MVLPNMVHRSAPRSSHAAHAPPVVSDRFFIHLGFRVTIARPVRDVSVSANRESSLFSHHRNRGMFPKMADVHPLPGSGGACINYCGESRQHNRRAPPRVSAQVGNACEKLITIDVFGETFRHDSWKRTFYSTQSCGATRRYNIWAQPGVPTARPQSARA